MSKRANAGEMRTLIRIVQRTETVNDNGFPEESWVNVYGEGRYVRCKWVNSHGSEVFSSDRYLERRTATATLRYSALAADTSFVVFLKGNDEPWEIVNADNVEGRNQWLELSLVQKVPAR
ncbi:MAG: head-tail adaptor protein [Oscillospiraceae bacterium]|nr:head-tail adaptor protein [Oscillospiraceae bacterium]